MILLFIIAFKQGATGYLKAELISEVFFLPFYYYSIRDYFKFSWNYSYLRNLLLFCLPIIPGFLSSWVLNLSDRIFLERYFTTAEVGIYSLGYQIAGLVLLFTTAFKSAYDPYFYHIANTKSGDEAKRILYKTNHIFLIVLILTSFMISFFAKDGVILFFNSKYYPAYQIVPLVSFGYLFSQNTALLNVMIYQEKKTKVVMYITIISALANIGLNFLIIPIWGIYGAAVSTLISYFILFVLSYILAKKYFFIPFNWNQLIPVLLGCLFVYSMTFIISFENVILSLIVKTSIILAIFTLFFLKYRPLILNIIRNK